VCSAELAQGVASGAAPFKPDVRRCFFEVSWVCLAFVACSGGSEVVKVVKVVTSRLHSNRRNDKELTYPFGQALAGSMPA